MTVSASKGLEILRKIRKEAIELNPKFKTMTVNIEGATISFQYENKKELRDILYVTTNMFKTEEK